MADFTKIDQPVAAALSAEEPHLTQRLAEIAPSEMQLDIGPCGRVIEEIARAAFSAAIEAASEDPELGDEEKLRSYLQVVLRPHIIDALMGERERAAVFGSTHGKRSQVLADSSLIGAGDEELFVTGSGSDSWEVAPAEVQVAFEPIGLYERLAPLSCRYVMRGNAVIARKILGQLFEGAVERFFTRLLATRGMPLCAETAGAASLSPRPNSETHSRTLPSRPRAIGDRKKRNNWLTNQMVAANPPLTSDLDIERAGGPAYNTIKKYRAGEITTRTAYVRSKLANAFRCNLLDVPE